MTNRYLRPISGCLLIAAAIFGSVATGSANTPGAKPRLDAANGSQGNPGILPPGSSSGGQTYGEWSKAWWLWSFSLDLVQNPTTNFAASCTNGQAGHTWYLYGGPPTVTCTVAPGTAIFLPVVNVECSSLEPPPFHGDNTADRQACAKAWMDAATNLFASVDGAPVQNVTAYRAQSGDFAFTVPANNILGAPAGASGFSSADGFYLLLPPLSAGTHTIRVKGDLNDPFTPGHPLVFPLDTTITLTVGR